MKTTTAIVQRVQAARTAQERLMQIHLGATPTHAGEWGDRMREIAVSLREIESLARHDTYDVPGYPVPGMTAVIRP